MRGGGGATRGEDQGSGLDGGHRVELAAKVADELHVALVVLLGRGDDLRGQIGVTGRGKALSAAIWPTMAPSVWPCQLRVLRVRKLPLKLALWAVIVTRSGGPDHDSSSTMKRPFSTRPSGTPAPRDQPSARVSVAP
jgi:hypothetical protein